MKKKESKKVPFDTSNLDQYIFALDLEQRAADLNEVLSYSKMRSYNYECKFKFFLERFLGIVVPAPDYFWVGSEVHSHCGSRFWFTNYKSAEKFSNQMLSFAIGRQANCAEDNRPPGRFVSSNHFWSRVRLAQKYCKAYFEARVDEKRQGIPRIIEREMKAEVNGRKVRVIMDEISVTDIPQIIDIKTYRNPPQSETEANFGVGFQESLYLRALRWGLKHGFKEDLIERIDKAIKDADSTQKRKKLERERKYALDCFDAFGTNPDKIGFRMLFPQSGMRFDINIGDKHYQLLERLMSQTVSRITSLDFPKKPEDQRGTCRTQCRYFDVCKDFDATQPVKELSRLIREGILIPLPRKEAPEPGRSFRTTLKKYDPLFRGDNDWTRKCREIIERERAKRKGKKYVKKGPKKRRLKKSEPIGEQLGFWS